MKVVVMAEGRETRIFEVFPNISKPLISIQGIPVLERRNNLLTWSMVYQHYSDTQSYGWKDYASLFK